LLLASCSSASRLGLSHNGTDSGTAPLLSDTAELPEPARLEGLLLAELQRLGKSSERSAQVAVGMGGTVFNLQAHLIDADENDEGESVNLSWSYRNDGDYDQNGQVTVSDLTPLAQFWQKQAIYDDPAIHGGIDYWPSGQPLADGAVAPGALPAAGSGADNWRIAQVDGDSNGLVSLSDITPIAIAFGASVTSYEILRREEGTEEYSTLASLELPSAGAGRPLTLVYNDPLNVEDRGRLWEYVVQPFDGISSESGPQSNAALAVFGDDNIYPLAQMLADPTEGTIPLTVQFSALTEAAPLGSIINHEWDLDGDGNYELETGTDTLAEYTYDHSGVYIARLRATDDAARTAIAGKVITVGTAPVAVLKADPPGGEVPVQIHLDGRGSYSELGELVKYEWDLDGDGTFEIDAGPVPEMFVDFDVPGTVQIGLRVTDNIGLMALDTLELELRDDYDEVEPNLNFGTATFAGSLQLDTAPLMLRGNVGVGGYSGDQSDWYRFSVPTGCELTLIAETAGLDPILRVRIIDSDGQRLLASIDNLESVKQVTRGLRGAASYYLEVVNQHTITGLHYDYSLSMEITALTLDESENNDSALQADDLGLLNASILPGIWGSLGPDGVDGDDEDWYAFSINTADEYSFGLDFFHRDADLELALYGADGIVLFGVSESVTDGERIDVALEPGAYRLRCYRRDGGTAFYQLSLFFTP
jgi:hypothetical protein